LQVANGNALQNSTLTMGGGSLILDSAVSGNAFTLGGLAAISSGPGYDLALENNAATPNAVALSVGNNNSNTAYAGNLSGPGSLTKIGTGILALNSYNNYEGFTTVAAGTLLVNGSNTGTGAFNVAAGAILGGAGSLAVAVNVTGVLAPGASINVLTPGASIGTLTSGALNLADHSTYQYEVNSSVSPTVGADLYIVNGALNLGTSVTLNLSDLGTGMFATGTVFSLFNYATGSWNNALFTYNSAALADDTTFNFLNRPWSIDYNATTKGVNVAGTGSGNYVNITATDAYTLWIQTPAFAIPADQQDPNDDPDGDGASNLDEFAFGGIPNDPTHKGLIFGIQAASSGAGGAKQMILTIAVRNGVTFSSPVSPAAAAVSDAMVDGLNYTILGSSNLTDWTTPVIPAPVINPGLPTLPPGYQYVSFVLSGSDGLPTRGFLRAMVERP
jgi:autotransporter-associated beta strand protein